MSCFQQILPIPLPAQGPNGVSQGPEVSATVRGHKPGPQAKAGRKSGFFDKCTVLNSFRFEYLQTGFCLACPAPHHSLLSPPAPFTHLHDPPASHGQPLNYDPCPILAFSRGLRGAVDGEARDRVAAATPAAGRRDRRAGAERPRPRDKGLFPDVLVVVSLCNQSSEDREVPLYSLHTLKSQGRRPDHVLSSSPGSLLVWSLYICVFGQVSPSFHVCKTGTPEVPVVLGYCENK